MPRRIPTDRPKRDKNKRWSDNDKIKVVASYVILRNASRVEEATGVPWGTINYWRTLPWWKEVEAQVLREQNEEAVGQFSKIIKKTQELIYDRLENGDFHLTRSGEIMRMPVDAKTLNSIATVAVDKKLALQEDLINAGTKDMTMVERLKLLEDKFTKMVESKIIKGEHVVLKEGETWAETISESTQSKPQAVAELEHKETELAA